MKNIPYVSVIIPARNEERYIIKCLNSLLSQDYAKDKLEVLVVDGMSQDSTVQKINDFLETRREGACCVKVIHNPRKIVPCGLNIGIREAKGDFIIRMDAHSECAPDYIKNCVRHLTEKDADNVGGLVDHRANGIIGEAIALAQGCRFGLGGAKFRIAKREQHVDTVFPGAWPRRTFERYGLFDERLVRNQDIEFNSRIRKNGGRIFLTTDIKSFYQCRDSLKGLWRQNFNNGKWVIFTKKIAPYCFSLRHFVPFAFVFSLLVTLLLGSFFRAAAFLFFALVTSYILASFCFSILISVKNGIKYFFVMPAIFATLHFSYGLGSIWGLLTLKQMQAKTADECF